MAESDPTPPPASPADPVDPGVPARPFLANPVEWVRLNRAKAEILAIGIVSIGLIFCMMVLVAIGLWRTAGQ